VPEQVNAGALIAVVILGIFGTGLTFALNYRLIAGRRPDKRCHRRIALGAIVLSEELNVRIVAGMVVVLAGVGMTRWQKRRRWRATSRPSFERILVTMSNRCCPVRRVGNTGKYPLRRKY
jgi:hypothetical protein